MAKINVYVLEFHNCTNIHVGIVLEEEINTKESIYYYIDRWIPPKDSADKNNAMFLKWLTSADKHVSFAIDGNMNNIITAWITKYNSAKVNMFCNNCADATAWFLDAFAHIPNPGSCGKPITCNYIICGLFAPSFLQCCTTPRRVISYLENHMKQNNNTSSTQPKTLLMIN